MQTKTIVRLGAVAFVAVAITASAMQARISPMPVEQGLSVASISAKADPLRAELVRCQSLGAAGADDHECLRAWAENRRRFLAPGSRPEAVLPAMGIEIGNSGSGADMGTRSVNAFDAAPGEEH